MRLLVHFGSFAFWGTKKDGNGRAREHFALSVYNSPRDDCAEK